MAYQLQAAKIQQKIRNEEIQVEVVERRKQIEIEEQEIKRKEKVELIAAVQLPADAEAFKVQTVAEGQSLVKQHHSSNQYFYIDHQFLTLPRVKVRKSRVRANANERCCLFTDSMKMLPLCLLC